MVHSDNMGLVLPPRVAQVQVVIIPILKKGDDMEAISAAAQGVFDKLKKAGVKVVLDDRENYNPGFKYNHWELRGTPIRLELGKKDFEKKGLIFSALSPDGTLPEIIELNNHPWFVGVQFHPEFKSRPFTPHPLFSSFIKAANLRRRIN